jgi:hypothetical protein
MTSTSSIRTLILTATLTLGAPALAMALPPNTGRAAEASDNPFAYSMDITRSSPADMVDNTGRAAQPDGSPLAMKLPTAHDAVGDGAQRQGKGASAPGGFGTGPQG